MGRLLSSWEARYTSFSFPAMESEGGARKVHSLSPITPVAWSSGINWADNTCRSGIDGQPGWRRRRRVRRQGRWRSGRDLPPLGNQPGSHAVGHHQNGHRQGHSKDSSSELQNRQFGLLPPPLPLQPDLLLLALDFQGKPIPLRLDFRLPFYRPGLRHTPVRVQNIGTAQGHPQEHRDDGNHNGEPNQRISPFP